MNLKQARKRMDDAQQAATQAVERQRNRNYISMNGAEIHNVRPEQLKQQPSETTPLPWSVNESEVYDGGRGFIVWGPDGPGCGAICRTFRDGLIPSETEIARAEADATLIVTAVNSHAALVEAIESEAVRRAVAAGLGASEWPAFLWPEAEAALALAAGEVGEA